MSAKLLWEYIENEDLKYPYLIANESILKNYQIRSVPLFYHLDRNQLIRQRIGGFKSGTEGISEKQSQKWLQNRI